MGRKQERYRVNEERTYNGTPCWEWLLAISKYGYGIDYINGNNVRAHIASWERVNGKVPENHDLDHLCRNRRCINPDHLEPVTRAVNIQRGNGAKLNAETVREIRQRYADGNITLKQLEDEYGVSDSAIGSMIRGKSWTNITQEAAA